jgi:ADP-ribose pyrophosphatase YjhB (NUDIX family)
MPAAGEAGRAAWLDEASWAAIQEAVPIACVDLVPVRRQGAESRIGLIQRLTPFDGRSMWCQIGGRIRLDETVRAALLRHLGETLTGASWDPPADPQPDYVMQWFSSPPDDAPVGYGLDPRRHAVALSFRVVLSGDPLVVPGGEALAFAWLTADDLRRMGDDLWPGTLSMVRSLGLLDE